MRCFFSISQWRAREGGGGGGGGGGGTVESPVQYTVWFKFFHYIFLLEKKSVKNLHV